ncbi:hypothetical protein [Microbacterium pumilum]|uniref:Antitoxin n=1 Tax=Microbacterium pumilum TaxID=344165 RepID=A0ABN2T4L6_9MICO
MSDTRPDARRLTRTTSARRERGHLRDHLVDLMDANAPISETQPIRERIQQLNTQIEREDGHR